MIESYIKVIYNVIRFTIKKFIFRKNINFKLIQTISLNTKIKIINKGELSLGYNVCISEYGSVFVGENGNLKIDNVSLFQQRCIY